MVGLRMAINSGKGGILKSRKGFGDIGDGFRLFKVLKARASFTKDNLAWMMSEEKVLGHCRIAMMGMYHLASLGPGGVTQCPCVMALGGAV